MAAQCHLSRYCAKTGLSSIGGEISTTNNLQNKGKLEEKDDSSLGSGSSIVERRGKRGGESENTTDSLKNTSSSLKFKQFSQEELKKIYEQEIHWPDSLNFEEELEESDEDDVCTEEEHNNTEGYEFTIKGLDAMLGKPLNGAA